MGGIPRPIVAVVWAILLVVAGTGFTLGFTGADHKATTADATPIATNLPTNAVIKDALPYVPPAPPPPKAKVQAAANSDDADTDESDQAAAPPTRTARTPSLGGDIPPPLNPEPSAPGQGLPGDLPPT